MTDFPSLSKQTWPKEPGEVPAFYGGNPRSAGWEAANLVNVPVPWAMQYAGKPVKSIRMHRRCAASLTRILNAIWDYYGHDQAKINAGHLNEFGGSFNIRANRNNPSQLSIHSYGAALDLAPAQNPNGRPWVDNGVMMPRPVIDAFKAEGWAWGGDFSGTKDAMHFQATFDRHAAVAPPAVSAFRFEAKATGIMRRLMADFPMRDFHAAGILGNIGHECAGFTLMQQAGKTPPAGGWSWCQWDGVRRTAFNEWADQHGLARDSDEAAYSFLVHELRTTEKGALNALLSTTTLEEATITFSRKFERPGIPHEDRRIAYAKRALEAFRSMGQPPEQPPRPPVPTLPPTTPAQHWSLWGAIAAAFAGIATFFEGKAIIITGVAILIAFAAFILRPKKAP